MRRTSPLALAAVSAVVVALLGLVGAGPSGPAALTGGPSVAAGSLVAAVAEPGAVRFTAAGDYAATPATRTVLQAIADRAPDLNLALGDLSYGTTGAEQAWCDLVTGTVGVGFPFELISGNHESNGLNGNINDFAACLPNQLPGVVGTYGRQWYVDVPEQDPLVRFVMISPSLTFPDGTYQYTPGSARYAWTAAAIDGARAAGVPWVVVGIHKPCLSMGEYGCDIGQGLQDLLLTRKVDLVLHGHEHLYQRTAQLGLGPACPGVAPLTFDADCVVDADGTLAKGAGTVLVTVGTGGVPLRAVNAADTEAGYFAASSGGATGAFGVLDVRVTATTLSAGFLRASGGDFADAFTISAGAPPANTPPSASATATCTGLDCTFDGSASADVDGTVVSHTWSFGDGTSGTGATATHRYTAAGTFTAALTVTDDDGATGTTSRTVTVAPLPPAGTLVADTFGRTTTNGFGSAETGGAWRTTGSTASYAVNGGAGRVTLAAAGAGPDVSLPAVSSSRTDLSVSVSPDKVITGSGLYVAVSGRRVAGVGEYRAKVQLRSTGAVTLSLTRTAGSGESVLAPAVVVPGLTYAAGDRLLVRTHVTGTSPTTLAAKVWKAGTPEPTTWQVSATDGTAGLQVAGSVGVNLYLSTSATNAPVRIALDDLLARTS
jgi:PKD repeat protein